MKRLSKCKHRGNKPTNTIITKLTVSCGPLKWCKGQSKDGHQNKW